MKCNYKTKNVKKNQSHHSALVSGIKFETHKICSEIGTYYKIIEEHFLFILLLYFFHFPLKILSLQVEVIGWRNFLTISRVRYLNESSKIWFYGRIFYEYSSFCFEFTPDIKKRFSSRQIMCKMPENYLQIALNVQKPVNKFLVLYLSWMINVGNSASYKKFFFAY